jgi:hypothetical protein
MLGLGPQRHAARDLERLDFFKAGGGRCLDVFTFEG